MDNAELGKLIKEARIAKKLTQSEVVGDFITRNMLSQIENGTAAPSIKTLQYLTNVLDLHINIEDVPINNNRRDDINPASDAASDSCSADIKRLRQLKLCKELICKERYDKALEILDNSDAADDSALYDEYCALSAKCNYEYAVQLAKAGNAAESLSHARKAIQLASCGIYANNDIHAKSLLLSHEQVALL